MMSTAAGLSLTGKIPFVNSFAVFASGRAYDQFRQTISIAKLNVKVCGSSSGLSDFGMPLSIPAIASSAILSFFGAWNDLILALILLKDNTMQTISLGLVSFTNEQFSNYTGQFAAVIVSIIPTLILYFILQKQIMKGMTAGAVKG